MATRQHVGERLEQLVDIDGGRLQHLAPGECQQLARQLRAAARGTRRGIDELARVAVASHRRQLVEHLQIALDDRQQVVEVMGDSAGELADALQSLGVAERLFGSHALQAAGEQIGQRLQEADIVVAERPGPSRARREDADGPATIGDRDRERARQAGVEIALRHGEAPLARVVGDDDGAPLRQHESERGVRAIGDELVEPLAGHGADRAGDAKLEKVALEQVDHGDIDLQRPRRQDGHLVQQFLRVPRVDGHAAEHRQLLAVLRLAQRLLDARIGADVADGRHDEGPAAALERAQCDLDDDLRAILAPRHEIGALAHRTRPRVATEGVAIARVLRPDRLGNERLHRQPDQLVDGIAEQDRRRRIGQDDGPARVSDHEGIRIGFEQHPIEIDVLAFGKEARGGDGRGAHGASPQAAVTDGRKT